MRTRRLLKMRGGKCLKMIAGGIKNVIIFDIFL